MRRIFMILLRPGECTASLKANPVWLTQFIFLASAGILLGIGSHSSLVQITLDHLPSSASGLDKAAVKELLDSQLWLNSAFLPFKMLVGFAGTALLLFFASRAIIANRSARFVELFSLELHVETVLLIGQTVALASAFLGIQENPSTNPLGIDRALPYQFGGLMVMNSFNPFTLWYLVLLVRGIAFLFECKLWRSIVAVAATWGITLVFQEGVFLMLKNSFHFQL